MLFGASGPRLYAREWVENDQSFHATAGRPLECSAGVPERDSCVTSQAICRLSNLTSLTGGILIERISQNHGSKPVVGSWMRVRAVKKRGGHEIRRSKVSRNQKLAWQNAEARTPRYLVN